MTLKYDRSVNVVRQSDLRTDRRST